MNKYIDHTLLKANATSSDIKKLCEEAIQYDFMSVCVNPCYVGYAKELLSNSNVLVCTVIGFPLGANSIEIKQAETIDAINNGADEIDMVINIGAAKEHNYDYLLEEIKAVVSVALGKTVKVIIETCYLTDEEKNELCRVATLAGAHFVKTSTGFGSGGATVHDVSLMRKAIYPEMSVKASGGIRTKEEMIKMIEAGASRIGTSSGTTIIGGKEKDGYSSY